MIDFADNRFHSVEFLQAVPKGHFLFTFWFVETWRRLGGRVKKDSTLPHLLRVLCGRYFGFNLARSKGRLVVCGWHRIESATWPWNYLYEIVPMMWDLWPWNYHWFARYLRMNRVRLAFCSSRVNVERLRREFPNIRVVWIPEAVDVTAYPMGARLKDRSIDILSYGRQFETLDVACREMSDRGELRYQRGTGPAFEDLLPVLQNSKIVVSYPRSDTNPELAGNVETLTIRYWEAMLSGAVLVGRSPRELIDVCGYDPVVPMDKDNPAEVIKDILSNLDKYQELVDRNRRCAENRAGWDDRLEVIAKNLTGELAEYKTL